MKLSEAIRKGAKLRPQAHGRYFESQGETLCSCALGAAWEGVELHWIEIDAYGLEAAFPALKECVWNPSKNRYANLIGAVIRLNDEEKWSREQIADYVESLGY